MPKPNFTEEAGEQGSDLLTKKGKVKQAGLLQGKKPTLNKFSSTKANGLPRKARM